MDDFGFVKGLAAVGLSMIVKPLSVLVKFSRRPVTTFLSRENGCVAFSVLVAARVAEWRDDPTKFRSNFIDR